ncbi:MAG: GNAT family N-acetyltransferase [Micavibrio sp.]
MTESVPVTYRAAIRSDAAVIYALVRELAVYERLEHEVVSSPEHFETMLFGEEGGGRFFCYLAECGGEVAGFCIGFYTLSTFLGRPGLYIEDVYVRESSRNAGIGKGFFKIIAQKAAREDCGRIEWSVLDWNEPSIKFYDKLGAKPLSGWIKYRLDGDAIKRAADL